MKLNLGAGSQPIEGYANLDGAKGESIYPLCCTNVEEIRSSHVLEHFSVDESVEVLLNWVDCLKEGGILKIAVPDFDDLIRRYSQGEQLQFEHIVMGGQTDERDYHKSIWTLSKLRYIMDAAGLVDICTWQSSIRDCASLPYSLNLQGRKSCQK